MSETVSTGVVPQPRLRAALEQVRPAMQKLEEDDLLQISVDPFVAVSTARGALQRIMKYHGRIVALPEFDRVYIDDLETFARATHFTQTLLQAASAPPENFAALVSECTALRETLLNDATALAKRGLISDAPLQSLKGASGHKHVASDLMTICNVLQAAWPKLAGKTCVTDAELERAEILSDQLINDIGAREQAPATIAAVALERQQAFTLFMTAYDQIRRAITYLRWEEGDADEIAPSLYAGRGGSRKKAASELEKKPEVPVTAATPATGTPATPTTTAGKPAAGLPGADPFAN
jgi:hypothetical protein